MKILILEDDEDKRRSVTDAIGSLYPTAKIDEARSFQSALTALLNVEYDLVLLDMTVPTFDITVEEDGGRPQAFGGRDLLRHIARRGIFPPAIVVTQFDRFGPESAVSTLDELDKELRIAHPANYLGAVFYDSASDTWKTDLYEILQNWEPHQG